MVHWCNQFFKIIWKVFNILINKNLYVCLFSKTKLSAYSLLFIKFSSCFMEIHTYAHTYKQWIWKERDTHSYIQFSLLEVEFCYQFSYSYYIVNLFGLDLCFQSTLQFLVIAQTNIPDRKLNPSLVSYQCYQLSCRQILLGFPSLCTSYLFMVKTFAGSSNC